MGNALNGGKLSLLRETERFAKWDVSDLRRLLHNFHKTAAGFSMIRAQFVAVLEETKPELTGQCDRLFTKLDNDGDGRIDGLEFMGGLALIARGSFEDKTKVGSGGSWRFPSRLPPPHPLLTRPSHPSPPPTRPSP